MDMVVGNRTWIAAKGRRMILLVHIAFGCLGSRVCSSRKLTCLSELEEMPEVATASGTDLYSTSSGLSQVQSLSELEPGQGWPDQFSNTISQNSK